MPDGITQPGNIDLETVSSMEILRGPFSSMYGSAAGGVISIKTMAPPEGTNAKFSFLTGSYGTTKESAQLTGTANGVGYLFDESVFNTNGYRDNSQAHKKQSTVKFTFDLTNGTRVNVLADYLNLNAQDPLGLSGIGSTGAPKWSNTTSIPSVYSNPSATTQAATGANTRVHRENTQVGVSLEHTLNESNKIDLVVYGGHRNNAQFLSTSATPSTSNTYATSVVANQNSTNLLCPTGTYCGRDSMISRDFIGTDLNWTNKGFIFDKKYSITTGLSYAWMSDERNDIQASNGVIQANGLTYPNRKETDYATNIDEFIQGQIALSNSFDIHAGIRNIHSRLSVSPHAPNALSAANNISSGSLSFDNTTPAIGAIWKANQETNFYANYAKGFQSPNTIQIAYNSMSGAGPNFGLGGSTSDNYEIGMKSILWGNTSLNLALYKVVASNEVAIDNTLNSYTVYRNLPVDTERKGLELSIDSKLEHNFELYGAYSYMDAKYNGAFTSYYCTSSYLASSTDHQCKKYGSTSNVVTVNTQAGNTIPGTYKQQLYGQVSWKYPDLGFRASFEGIANSRVYANDINTAYAQGYTIFNLRAGFNQKINNWELSEFALIGNVFDKAYISSVRVNDSNGAFYEAGTDRNYMAGFSISTRF
jgi:iron complex outermembrane receptor protein